MRREAERLSRDEEERERRRPELRETRSRFPSRLAAILGALAMSIALESDLPHRGKDAKIEPTHEGGRRREEDEEEDAGGRRQRDLARAQAARLVLGRLIGELESRQRRGEDDFLSLQGTDVTIRDVADFAEDYAHEYPHSSAAGAEFQRLLQDVRIEHDGASYYVYPDSEELEELSHRSGMPGLDALLLLQKSDDPGTPFPYYLETFIESPDGLDPVGRRVYVDDPEAIRRVITMHILDQLSNVTSSGYP